MSRFKITRREWPKYVRPPVPALKQAFKNDLPLMRIEPREGKCFWVVVVMQMVERSLPTPEIRGSNIINGNFIYVLPVNCIIKVVP